MGEKQIRKQLKMKQNKVAGEKNDRELADLAAKLVCMCV